MRYILENEILKAEIDSFGAELKSVKSKANGKEYMWNGDKKYWGRTSPVLFPFVGSLQNKQYSFQDKTYPMGQHGFARDMEHTMISQTENELWFELTSTEETLKKYPFPFVLYIGYTLLGNILTVMWKVKNPAKETMYFSIGAHPAFLCPIHGEKNKEGYALSFGDVQEIHHHGNTVDTGMALEEDLILPLKNGMTKITPEFFDRCTYMIEGKQTGKVGLVDSEGNEYITVFFDAPLFAIWSPEGKNAPFVCIEPWYGRCDGVDADQVFENKAYINRLEPGQVFNKNYHICIY